MSGHEAESADTGASLIAAERRRQIDAEGYTPAHDREHHHPAQFIEAAIAYMSPNDGAAIWPWEPTGFKPEVTHHDLDGVPGYLRHGSVRDLVKAGALVAAAIDALRNPPAAEVAP
jgi:hypothetical protein